MYNLVHPRLSGAASRDKYREFLPKIHEQKAVVKNNEESSTSTSIESPPPEYIPIGSTSRQVSRVPSEDQDTYREFLPKIHEPKAVVENDNAGIAKTRDMGYCYFDGCLNRVYKGFCATHAQEGNVNMPAGQRQHRSHHILMSSRPSSLDLAGDCVVYTRSRWSPMLETVDFTIMDEVILGLTEERQEAVGGETVKEKMHSANHTPSSEASASNPHVPNEQFHIGQHVWVVLGKERHPAIIHSIADDSTDDPSTMVTIKWSVLGTYENFPIDSLLPMFEDSNGEIVSSSYSRRIRKKTDAYAPPPTFSMNSVDQAKDASTKKAEGKDPPEELTAKKRNGVFKKTPPGPGWRQKSEKKNGLIRSRWLSPSRGIKFTKWKAACKFEELRKTFGSDEVQAWGEYRKATAGAKTCVVSAHFHDATQNDDRKATRKNGETTKGRQNSLKCLPGPGWKRMKKSISGKANGKIISHLLSPNAEIKFVSFQAALKFEKVRKKYNFDDAQAWNEYMRVSAGVGDSRYMFAVKPRAINKSSVKEIQEISSIETSSADPSAVFQEGQRVCVVIGKASHQAEIVSIKNCAQTNQPQMATVRWLTWKGVDDVEAHQLRPIYLDSKRERKQTDRFAPSSRRSEVPKEEDVSQSINKKTDLSPSKPLSKKATTREMGQEKRGKIRKRACKRRTGSKSISPEDGVVLLALQEEGMRGKGSYGDGVSGGGKKRRRPMTIKEIRDRLFDATGNRVSKSAIRQWLLSGGGGAREVGTRAAPYRVSGKDKGKASVIEKVTTKANQGKTKKNPPKIEKEEPMANSEIENEYIALWKYYMEPRVRKNEELVGSGMVLRKKIASCSLLRSKNDIFRKKVHGKVMRLHKKGGRKCDILRILKLLMEHDSGKLGKDELHQLIEEILGPLTGHNDVEVLDSLAVSALQACDRKIKENVHDLVEPIASNGSTEHSGGFVTYLTSAGASAQERHPGIINPKNGEYASNPSYQKQVAAHVEYRSLISVDNTSTANYKMATKTADSGEIAMDIAHSKEVIDLCRDEEIEPSQHESKLHGRKTSSVSLASIDSSRKTTRVIDLYQDDDIDDGDSQQTSDRQRGARENTTSGTNNEGYGSANYHGQISDHNILKSDRSSNETHGFVDLSQESDTDDLPSDWV
ncbi:hypothetical protein ACHAW5_004016 [Stephanodiscus triporus]|uniref:BAH domain-containing protein n=1 Tax=Stephanodiscus triporus TaxID=2934178 RepID=A0ABD3PBA7_9STRA